MSSSETSFSIQVALPGSVNICFHIIILALHDSSIQTDMFWAKRKSGKQGDPIFHSRKREKLVPFVTIIIIHIIIYSTLRSV